jgi:oligoendopeptidase F
MAVALKKRSELEKKYTWNLAGIYANTEEFEADRKRLEEALPRLEGYKGQLASSGRKLLEWFRDSEQAQIWAGHLLVYSTMLHDSDTTNQEAAALKDPGAHRRVDGGGG